MARIVPAGEDTWDDLILRGDVIPSASQKDLLNEPPADYGFDATAALQKLRADER